MKKILSIFKDKHQLSVVIITFILSILATGYLYSHNLLVSYGDAESHLNIAKRVVSGVTGGFGQMGGIWLPLLHILLLPFVKNDFLWRSGLAGSIVVMNFFILGSLFIYKTAKLLTQNKWVGVAAALIFATNPNILFMQSTAMSEIPSLAVCIVSTYFFLSWITKGDFIKLLFAGLFVALGTLIRYDAWFLFVIELALLIVISFIRKYKYSRIEALSIAFSYLAFAGIAIWMIWNLLIFKDPLNFIRNPYSSGSQQITFQQHNQLPSLGNLPLSAEYYGSALIDNVGIIFVTLAFIGLCYYLRRKRDLLSLSATIILLSPFVFYTVCIYIGQAIIFTPELTPKWYDWQLFNIRYGLEFFPSIAIFAAMLASRSRYLALTLIILAILQSGYFIYTQNVITLTDGTSGLSARRYSIDAQNWLVQNYDCGNLVYDDFSRVLSAVSLTNIPMNKIVYVGDTAYWNGVQQDPGKYVRWIVVNENGDDRLWTKLKDNQLLNQEFDIVYNAKDIYIYKSKSSLCSVTN